MRNIADNIKIIDVDSHIVEPPDLWTKRLSHKWDPSDLPQLRHNPDANEDWWYVAGKPEVPLGMSSMAGWNEYYPDRPKTFDDLPDSGMYDAKERLVRMDEMGIFAQLLYPNVSGFGSGNFGRMQPELALDCIRTYNDFLSEWTEADTARLIPLTALPLWDIDIAIKEIERTHANGHKGLVMSAHPDRFSAPMLADPYWFPLWEVAQERDLPINFHIGSGGVSPIDPSYPDSGRHANTARESIQFFMNNADAITTVIFSGLCHRFPRLNFVSVESGIGWVPYLNEAMDWQWQNDGVWQEHPEYDLLPSEYFRRQVYACFWFERLVPPRVLDLIGDNVLYETDYPHPTSMSPGPASFAVQPRDFLDQNYSELPDELLHKILHDNAARIYGLE